ncbi:LOW QUALITY PROTEIN: hypothetical protein V2J09_015202 [Rumex salicifolius]
MEERSGGSGGLMHVSSIFIDLVNRLELLDMWFSGSKFTWWRGLGDSPIVAKHLDRFLSNVPALVCLEEPSVRHLSAMRSDHNPLFLSLSPGLSWNRRRRPVRVCGLSIRSLMKFVEDNWIGDLGTTLALTKLKEDLQQCNKEWGGPPVYFSFSRNLTLSWTTFFCKKNYFGSKNIESNGLNVVTEILSFFTLIPLHRNNITALKNELNEWVDHSSDLENMVVQFFINLYTLPAEENIHSPLLRGGFPWIQHTEILQLIKPFVRRMGAYKALVDGFQQIFITSVGDHQTLYL